MRFRKFLLVALVGILAALNGYSQSRKYISQFSHFQSYFNPGLTGYEGSTLRGFVRNQWSGIEGAPKTYFFSAEMDFGQLSGEQDPDLMGKNAASVNLLHDSYGAFRETELIVAYASRIRISEKHNLRLGAGFSYQQIRLDGNSLTTEEQNDPTLGQYFGQFSDMQILDFNIGMALTHRKYYVSYGMHRVNGGRIKSGDEFMDGYPASKMLQAGFRERLSPNLAVITNAFFRSQKNLPDQFDVNLKVLLMDRVWVGGGHRFDYASNFQFGILTDRLRIGYIFEFPVANSYQIPGRIHEFTAVFNLFGKDERDPSNDISIW
ncbi:PorP/SprF family type IX secretion system membrane protein [Algoriphagus limi]|uniref:Type IX secretion system membrane protein PorP/SprF n=1 Tax=Algoriphagus limi TaxID=2975273 RepID=A0ABT2GBI3_9BACT|nr:type IX secretion system membrane protein PorP/SprF [Algoriphagus limi]MCS5491766.1 type IX secretion system membrane protein PorP/SprF [Algoriphagus limi]